MSGLTSAATERSRAVVRLAGSCQCLTGRVNVGKLHQFMTPASDPNSIVANIGLAVLALAALWRFFRWVREAPVRPDPWDAELEQKLSDPEAVEVCPHCLTEQPPTAWFCIGCGRAIGPYNNVMPYLQIFSEGEVFRNGTSERMRKSPIIPIGYFLISLGFVAMIVVRLPDFPLLSLIILAGLLSYWVPLLKNLNRSKEDPAECQSENNQ